MSRSDKARKPKPEVQYHVGYVGARGQEYEFTVTAIKPTADGSGFYRVDLDNGNHYTVPARFIRRDAR